MKEPVSRLQLLLISIFNRSLTRFSLRTIVAMGTRELTIPIQMSPWFLQSYHGWTSQSPSQL